MAKKNTAEEVLEEIEAANAQNSKDAANKDAAVKETSENGIVPETDGQPQGDKPRMEEITLKFGKGCVGEPFQGKDGNEYREILVPNKDPEDKRAWQTFVVKSNHVHENQFGKGMWCKLPAEGSTTLHRRVRTGTDEQGKPIWDTEKTKVSNKELKGIVEAYKEKNHDRTSVKEKIEEKKSQVAEKKAEYKAKTQHKTKDKQQSL